MQSSSFKYAGSEENEMTIRPEHPDDYNAILRLTYEAFLTSDYPGRRRVDEHYLIHLLQSSPFVIPELCFVTEQDGEIVGHIEHGFTRGAAYYGRACK